MPVSPIFFCDDFESGDTSKWTEDLLNTTASVITTYRHHGKYCLQMQNPTPAGGEYGRVYTTFTGGLSLYMREYIRLNELFTAGWQGLGPRFANTVPYTIGYVIIDCPNLKWGVRGRSGGSLTSFWEATTSKMQAGIWYCVELYAYLDNSAGIWRLWIDGTLKINQTGLDTYDGWNIDRAGSNFYIGTNEAAARTEYFDCAAISSMYIGPEKRVMSLLGRGGDMRQRSNLFSTVRCGRRMGLK